jgi:hypothetical protein
VREDDFCHRAGALDIVHRGIVTLGWAIENFVGNDIIQRREGTDNQ